MGYHLLRIKHPFIAISIAGYYVTLRAKASHGLVKLGYLTGPATTHRKSIRRRVSAYLPGP
jgi:hypothetical protein